MNKVKMIMIGICICFGLTACGPKEEDPVQNETTHVKDDAKVLVAYFSRIGNAEISDNETDTISSASLNITDEGIQGNTEIVAKQIQQLTNSDLYLIEVEEKYPADYSVIETMGKEEGQQDTRPTLISKEDIRSYDVIILGFPNWWYDMPMAMYSFLETNDFSGKTILPFVTSGGSGFSESQDAIKELQPNATVLDGLAIPQALPDDTNENITEWLTNAGILK